ncbi:ABC-2 type transporter-domain-containing protein [Penicillium nucicola]|uniref:ABC-2 type transporter-domain-containing protein n=1 Tax=Penicillium nucicola TaxID=1850975 RepID=UPI002544D867|nr:ABC-2 type transporter-domain-containing protein [Penicillium nucicola]KAJ5751441.1 ABC-2 type transporter-domain-containing protein [Penicillium nucicola]
MNSPSSPEALASASDPDHSLTNSASTLNLSERTAEDKDSKFEWSLATQVKAIKQQQLNSGLKRRELGIQWDGLTVQAPSVDAAVKDNALSQFNIFGHIRKARQKPPMKTILNNSHGCVKPGEMLLVLGRPGSGCTTLLKVLANRRQGYSIEGDIHFGSMSHQEAAQYRGQIVMNTEEEIFFPTLTVGETMDFATRLKAPAHPPQGAENIESYRQSLKSFLLESMSISHTANTKVGNEYIRGVSGGERKRVSIIECLGTGGSTFCWDNSTRGLDASTALDWAKALRSMTNEFGLTTVVTLYQAGNGIYDLFDKVLVLDESEQIYYGPMKQARSFMEGLGFVCRDGSNVADFLTGVTMPAEREIRSGYEQTFPRNAKTIRSLYDSSTVYSHMIKEYDYPNTPRAKECTESFKQAVTEDRHPSLPKASPMTTSLPLQVKACIIRQYQIIQGDKATFLIKQISTLVQALVAGSLFYDASPDSPGLFIKSGACFFAVLYNGILMPMSEVTDSFFGRPVLIKHKHFAFFHPAAFCIAQIVCDIPTIIFQITHFTLVLYFMVGLKLSAVAFFTHWVIIFASTMCLTAMFRAIGAAFRSFDSASKISGFLTTALVVYTGYLIQKPSMHPWLGWIFWINPMAYAFEAILANEFKDANINCASSNLIPSGPGYSNHNHQSCAGIGGATQGEIFLTGESYLKSLSYSTSHVWRDFGILWAWWILFVAATIILTTLWQDSSESGSSLLIPYEKREHFVTRLDEEAQSNPDQKFDGAEGPNGNSSTSQSGEKFNGNAEIARNASVFTWKNLTYTVKTPTGDRVLLDNVQGWVKPGMLGALMGSSGAGKTTLLDVLAQRKTDGTIRGSILVDGRPLPVSFQRSAGYCEQLDVHEPYATVREAFEFSALLRQPQHIPKKEKLGYVDTIIDLLELHDLADTLIGTVGAGLSVEQRKRVTIGVELVAKPSILVFLDEPTSGLDGQSAFNTVRFLRKLADIGQAILVTIHQPSAQLFSQFDTLLLLAKGGKTVYFGDIGENGQAIKSYFGRYGAVCPPGVNPAEYMIDVVSGTVCPGQEWHQTWLESPEHDRTTKELEHILEEVNAKPPVMQNDENEFATSLWEQTKLVTHRMNVALYRNTEYVNNKLILHIISALFNGFSFWMIGDNLGDLQMRLFTIFNFIFVAPGVVNQLQPLFIERRDIYDTREKKSRMYSWKAFVTGLVVSEFPYLCLCAVLYFVCWYYTVGFPKDSNHAGASFLLVLQYEFIYTSLGQMIAAFAPNSTFAALANPVILGTIVAFCGMLVPYSEITPFWRYWLYYLNPFTYVTGGLLTFNIFGAEVKCASDEFAIFDPPSGQTCAQYLTDYMEGAGSRINLINPSATAQCQVCQYRSGSDYLYTLNLKDYSNGWRNIGITVIFIISSYATVFAMMKLRTKASKKTE